MNWKENKFLLLLGIPAIGLSLVYILITAYLPYFFIQLSSVATTGMMLALEGIFALGIPFFVGAWSDSVWTPIGRRLPFFIAGALLTSVILILMPFSVKYFYLLVAELMLFYAGYFTMYESYFTMYLDHVPLKERGRSQGIRGGYRSFGLLIALVAGGTLLYIWTPLPFILFTVVLLIVTLILFLTVIHRIDKQKVERFNWWSEWNLIQNNPKIRLWVFVDICWEVSICILKVFIVLYFTQALNLDLNESSKALLLVGLVAICAGPVAGILADRYSHKPVILTAILFFAFGLLIPIFTDDPYYIAAAIPVTFSAIILNILPFSMLMGYLPPETRHGSGTALYGFCQGIGALIGPFTAGLTIEYTKNLNFLVFAKTKGYSSIFLLSSLFLFLSFPFAVLLFRKDQDQVS